jgi:hypothetical protein
LQPLSPFYFANNTTMSVSPPVDKRMPKLMGGQQLATHPDCNQRGVEQQRAQVNER